MIPEPDAVLMDTAGKLMTQIAPNMLPGYTQGSVGLLGMLLIMSSIEYGRAADIRRWENETMVALLKRGGRYFPQSRQPEVTASLAIADLNKTNHALAQALIELHTAVEDDSSTDAKSLERDILAYLKESGDRRRFYLPSMG